MLILLVEDDPVIADCVTAVLEQYGYAVVRARTGREALDSGPPDLVLLDLGLPDMDGLDVCRTLRRRADVPIIVITARSDEADTVAALEVGADDCVIKPFGVRGLIARIRAVSRRVGAAGARSAATLPPPPLSLGRVVVDPASRRVHLDGAELPLTPKEFDLLLALARRPGAVLTREALIDEVWDCNWFGSTRTLDVHVFALRRKLGAAVTITTLRGVGFRLDLP
ncbi:MULTISPECIES: response regulator transcription factor [unclassified Rathayibacter]|uniref:response regulator transcription factor n=1 Tax=unclassified Rathayibacter TaxID=2609250 RepID=UPI0010431EB2|nr:MULTISPECIES: response regulator transcription factor [unclassified Rathayibacter]MCJ1704331.1 response regulator transcription factor [Rathayibacter sp. VKM Ac-2926]TCL82961.1 DNA-binding response OmpR family regulator [Rathayibacter sp. PhB192]